MRKVYLDRLTKLGNHLLKKKLGHVEFYFGHYHVNFDAPKGFCGTSGCALGECPTAFPKQWKFNETDDPVIKENTPPFESATIFFGITRSEANHLFAPHYQIPRMLHPNLKRQELGDKATAKEVSENILHFVEIKKKEVSNVRRRK